MGKSLNALIVEDSEDDAILIVRELRRGGYDVTYERVEDAAAMRSALAVKPRDIVISDFMMPQFNGLEALKVLKNSGLDLPFILVSGVIGEDAGIEAMRCGAHDYLMKTNLARLVPAIDRELGEAKARRENRRAEQLVQEQAALIELAHDAIIVLDLDQKVVLWSRGATQTYGWTREEALEAEAPVLLKTRYPLPLGEIRTALLRDNQWEGELIHTHRNGEQIVVASRWAIQRGRRGEPIGTLEINRDITGRKRAEAELSEHLGRLEELVQARTAELTRTNQQLEKEVFDRRQAEEAVRQLNANLEQKVQERTAELAQRAVQLRALAAELTLSEQRERRRIAEVMHDHLQQLLVGAKFRTASVSRCTPERVKEEVREVENILDEALEASRSLTAELNPLVLREGGLAPSLEWLAGWMAKRHGLKVDLSLGNDLPLLAEDAKVLLFQSVRELLFNSVKHARVGSASVSVVQIEGRELRITVSDNGPGFDPARLQIAGVDGGGLGLFSIRERLHLVGGRMDIESSAGKGSRFTLSAPLSEIVKQ